jgi:dTDP-4-dehydrorhamnose 3,5-epimerase-like enzyme
MLSWEVTPCERCLVAVVDRLGIAGFLINQTKMMSDERPIFFESFDDHGMISDMAVA